MSRVDIHHERDKDFGPKYTAYFYLHDEDRYPRCEKLACRYTLWGARRWAKKMLSEPYHEPGLGTVVYQLKSEK